jgi:AraC family transcriptional regulator
VPHFLDDQVDPCVRHVFAGTGYVIGEFDCPPSAEGRWHVENWIGAETHVVVPGTPVWIIGDGAEPTVSTPNEVLLYDPDLRYRRRPVVERGDRCLFFVLSDDLAGALRLGRPTGRRTPRLRRQPIAAAPYAVGQRLRRRLHQQGGNAHDPLVVDEAALGLLGALAATLAGAAPDATRAVNHPDAVEAAKAMLAADLARRWTLADIAAAVHYSPFGFARMFRRMTGYTIQGYLRHLRLRGSLEWALSPGASLSEVAVAYGFASHSHYTRAFRQAFGTTPSRLRA